MQLRNRVTPSKFPRYSVEIIPAIHLSCSSPTRSSTPDFEKRLRKCSQDSTISPTKEFESLSRIEEKAYSEMIRDLMFESHSIHFDLILKDPQIGKIVQMNDHFGRIQTIDCVLSMRDFYFEPEDCMVEEEESPLEIGDRVMFIITVKERRIFATNVRRVAKRTISSPDLSRLVMRQTAFEPFDSFEL